MAFQIKNKAAFFPDESTFKKIIQIIGDSLEAAKHLYKSLGKKMQQANVQAHPLMTQAAEILDYCQKQHDIKIASQSSAWTQATMKPEQEAHTAAKKRVSEIKDAVDEWLIANPNQTIKVDYKVENGQFTRKYSVGGAVSDLLDKLFNTAFAEHNLTCKKQQMFEIENKVIKKDEQGDAVVASSYRIQQAVDSAERHLLSAIKKGLIVQGHTAVETKITNAVVDSLPPTPNDSNTDANHLKNP